MADTRGAGVRVLHPDIQGTSQRLHRFESLAVFRENIAAVAGAILVITMAALAILAPVLTAYDPLRGVGPALAAPQLAHPLGTDDLGRDVWAQVVYGLRISILVGLVSTAIAVVIGIVVGACAGFFGGLVDDLLMRITELFQVVPRFFLAILVVAIFGQRLDIVTLAIAALSWPPIARVIRADFLSRRDAEYVLAARVVGASKRHLIFREILPNAMAAAVVAASLNVGTAILFESGLAFIGLSDPNQVSLGRSLQLAIPFIKVAWWLSFFPGAALALLIMGLNLVGDGVNDVLNPRLRR